MRRIATLFVWFSAFGCGIHEGAPESGHTVEHGGALDGTKASPPEAPSNRFPAVEPAATLPLSEISVEVELLPANGGYKFTNHSHGSVWYTGYGPGSPLYDLQSKQPSSNWLSLLGWCGTDADSVELKENESLEVRPSWSNVPDSTDFIRVGIIFSGSPETEGLAIYGPEIPVVRP